MIKTEHYNEGYEAYSNDLKVRNNIMNHNIGNIFKKIKTEDIPYPPITLCPYLLNTLAGQEWLNGYKDSKEITAQICADADQHFESSCMNTETPLLSPFQEGFQAGFHDKTREDNPYPIDNPNNKDWIIGYLEAKLEKANYQDLEQYNRG